MQLITPEEVLGLAFSPDDAIDVSHIRIYRIEAAQLRYIRPAFGDRMYQQMIQERYDAFVSTYIRPALAHYVRYELISELAVRISDRGVVRPSSEERTQTSSATKNDSQDRTDTTRRELTRTQQNEKNVSNTSERTTTTQSSGEQTTDETKLVEETQQRTVNVTDSDRVTSESNSTEQLDSALSVTVIDKSTTDQTSGSDKTVDESTNSEESSSQIATTESSTNSQTVNETETGNTTTALEQSDLTTTDVTVAITGLTENSGTGTTSLQTSRVATMQEWMVMSRQALRDARLFLRVAVEYVEMHPDEFPDYEPLRGWGRRMPRRCLGGIIL